ncbi:MAG TPA: hypothetical protein VNH64_05795 [Parvularculaceae bacterium]|nr:hypothetical protein [Parvularculaceae bacterium]
MSMKLDLMTAASLDLDELSPGRGSPLPFAVDVGGYRKLYHMPKPGRAIARTIDLSPDILPSSGLVNFSGRIATQIGDLGFGFDNLGIHDSISVVHLSPRRFLVRVEHVAAPKGARSAPCRARCADGTEGQPCVDCVKDGVIIRICC